MPEESEHLTYRELLVELVAKSSVPAVYPYREFVEVGGLLSYSIDLAAAYRRLASLIDELLKGANPDIGILRAKLVRQKQQRLSCRSEAKYLVQKNL